MSETDKLIFPDQPAISTVYLGEKRRRSHREMSATEPSKMEKQQQQDEGHKSSGMKKGGIRTMPFIIANEAFEKVASYGLTPNMILYLIKDYKMGLVYGTNLLSYWTAASNFLPILGAVLADSYLGRFLTIILGCFFTLVGMVLFWFTTVIPKLKPPQCTTNCRSATPGQIGYLVFSFILMAIGAGGIRPCSMAFGADQLDRKDNPNNERVLETFFSWYYASTGLAVLIAFTVIVYVQDHIGWRVGFGVPVILMFLSVILFLIASPLYIKAKVQKSIITSFIQVIVAAFRNRKLDYPSPNSNGYYRDNGSGETEPTDNLRFLNKACIIRDPKDMSPEGVALDPWRLCSVQQVKELKALLRVMPLWSASIMLSIGMSQGSFQVLQAKSMDRHLTSSFQIPAASFLFFTIVAGMIWIGLYDRVLIPIASRIKGKPVHLGVKLRMGIGLCISFVGMAVAAIVENMRRKEAIKEGFLNNPQGVMKMSAMWLIPQHSLFGLAEAFNAIGQSEFYYTEFPKTMSTIATALFGLQSGVASLLASFILSTVDKVTSGGGKESWVSTNINKGRYSNYFWLLAIMSFINIFYYIFCSWAYGPCVDRTFTGKVESGNSEEELQILTPAANGRENGEATLKEESV